jgi:hypothetical protein
MKQFSFTISIAAKEKDDAIAKLTAISALAGNLTLKELAKLAHIVEHDPIKTAMAKSYLGV